ncbi:MAG: 3-ketoacyl-ACP reductase [Anaerolineae bacterium]|nr:3-ketoacyl-ACP reductase [Anaerolineae bacterium]
MSTTEVALVTGGSRGIGRGIAVALAGLGWRVALTYNRDATAAAEAKGLVEAASGEGLVIQADVAQAADRARLIDAVLAHWGRLDMLVNNAGMAPRKRGDLLEMTEESYDEVMATNLKGPFFLTQGVAKMMIEQVQKGVIQRPKIVNISSVSAYASGTNRGEYCISKAGMSMMTALYADRLAEYGILVYEIRPGVIETDMTAAVKAKYDRLIFQEKMTPIVRWGKTEDVSRAMLAIAQDLFPFSTGQVFDVDGGFHVRRL